MAGNRSKSENSLQFRKRWRWVAVCGVLTALGLVFVFQRINIHNLSEEIGDLQGSLSQIQQKNSVYRLEIGKLKSPEELQGRVALLGLYMIEMSDPAIEVIEARAGGHSMVADRRMNR